MRKCHWCKKSVQTDKKDKRFWCGCDKRNSTKDYIGYSGGEPDGRVRIGATGEWKVPTIFIDTSFAG